MERRRAEPMTRARRRDKPRERWLLTRKTWKYMADAGRRLVPDGAQNRLEDLPRLEAYFQDVCGKEPRFLLWRKSSYPGALPRPRRPKRRGGSVRARSPSDTPLPRPVDLPVQLHGVSGGRLDLAKLRRDFFAPPPPPDPAEEEEGTLVELLRTYLKIEEDQGPSRLSESGELVRALRRFLARQSERAPSDTDGDPSHRTLLETLGRYYSRSPNRDNIVQDLLTDRGLLKRLYHDLRKTKPYRGGRTGGGSGYTPYGFGRGIGRGGSHFPRSPPLSPPPLIEVKGESTEDGPPGPATADVGTQTAPVSEETLQELERKYRERLEAETAPTSPTSPPPERKGARRRSSVDHDDVSQSVSDTIKRYLRMARKKSVDADKADRFKRINYDKNLRNIKSKTPGDFDDDGLSKGCQTDEAWMLTYRDLVFASVESPPISPVSPTASHSFLSALLGRGANAGVPAGGMQKSRSSSSVVKSVSNRLWRTRSRSSSRVAATWTPQGSCCWTDGGGRCVRLADSSLLTLSEVERRALQQAALARLQQLSLAASIKIPDENAAAASTKPKRRAYLLKRKALTTGFFDARADKDKESSSANSVFGVPLAQCVETERALRRQQHSGSRASLSSLSGTDRADDSESCDSGDWGWAGLEAAGGGGPRVPALVSACLAHLRRHGLRTLGLFRVSASKKRVRQLREEWERGQEAALDAAACPHDVATLLKEFLRDLPDPLLCRDLYQAFLQTQKIRNRRLQWEAVRLVIQLLPAAHRDTLSALLSFLAQLAAHADDDHMPGNKMDAANLATVFAPNILHRNKPNEAASAEQLSERADVINVVRQLIERQAELWTLPAELLHEAYIHLAHTAPQHLDSLLMRRHECASERLTAEETEGERRVWSREEFLHGGAATGGPDKDVPLSHYCSNGAPGLPGRRSEKTYARTRRAREAASDTSSGSLSSAMTIVTRVRSSVEEYGSSGVVCSAPPSGPPSAAGARTDSAPDSNDSASDYNETLGGWDDDNCVITASLHIGAAFPRDPPPRPAPPPRRRSAASLSSEEAKRDSAVGSSSPASASNASSPPASPPPAALRVTLTSSGEVRRPTDIDKLISLGRERNTSDARAVMLRHHDEPARRDSSVSRHRDNSVARLRDNSIARPRDDRSLLTRHREDQTLLSRQREDQTLLSRQREDQTLLSRQREDQTLSRREERGDEKREGMLYKRGELISSARAPMP